MTSLESLHASVTMDASSDDLRPSREPTSKDMLSRLRNIVPYGGIVSNTFNLASATLGAGIVVLPSGFRDSGVVVASILLTLCCACTIYSIRLLVLTKEKTGLRSYEEMAQFLFGHGMQYLTAFLMFVFCFGTCVGYVISVGDLLFPLLDSPNVSPFLQTTWGNKLLVSAVWFVGMFFLSLPKEINSLRYASVVGVAAIVFFVISMIIHAAHHGMSDGISKDIVLARNDMSAISGLLLFIFAFICQVNCFQIYEEMTDRTPNKMTRDSAISMSAVGLLYFSAGFFGYADFGDLASSSVLKLYNPRENVLMAISYVGVTLKLCVGFAICIHPSRDAFYYLVGWGKTSDVSTKKNLLVSAILSFLALICGLSIPDITVFFELLGGVCGGFLAFLFPAFFYIYSGNWSPQTVGWGNVLATFTLVILGVVALVFGTIVPIYNMVV